MTTDGGRRTMDGLPSAVKCSEAKRPSVVRRPPSSVAKRNARPSSIVRRQVERSGTNVQTSVVK
ncbi:MAG TPA: hypothetical protein ENJ53_02900 [Phaeodactylibacter sp.]|nr:hypothetical protein [Phaeodactylibacter sp.]